MAKDYTKYTIEGVAENLGKSKLALAIIEDYVSKNMVDFAVLNAVFPDECQGGIHGVFRKKEEVKDAKRYYMDKPISLVDGTEIVVTNQWGIGNIPGLIERAEKLGYNIIATDDNLYTNANDENELLKQLKYFPHSLEQAFPNWLDKIEIIVTNSIEKIYEECGENVVIHFNVKQNSIIKHHTNEYELVHEYLNAFEVAIPDAYIENEEWLGEIRFMGIYENKDWEIVLNGNVVESQENVPADLKEALLKNFNTKNMFKFIDEVYQLF